MGRPRLETGAAFFLPRIDKGKAGMAGNCEITECPETMRPHVERVLRGEYDLPGNLRWKKGAIQYVCDIGANVGSFCIWARKKWPDCRITAFEPFEENRRRFLVNLPQAGGVVLRSEAVSDFAGDGLFFLGGNNCGEGSLTAGPEQVSTESITVPIFHAANLLGFDFMKIDAEGEELRILNQAPLRDVRGIALEWHSREDRIAIVRLLTSQGFDLVKEDPSEHPDRGTQVWARREWIEPTTRSGVGVDGKEIFLALPVYGDYEANFVHSLLRLMQTRPAPARVKVATLAGDSLVPRARNVLAARFLRSSATHLLFIDTDLIFSPAHIARIASHDVPIVAGLYPKKQRELGWVCNLLDEGAEVRDDGLLPAKYAGTGFLMIAREVLERMVEAYPEIEYDPDEGDESGIKWDFFATGVWKCPETGRRRYLSEDWFFCQRARDLGYEVLIDTSIVCKHVGKFIYPMAPESEWSEPREVEA